MNLRSITWLLLKMTCCASIVKYPKRASTRLQIHSQEQWSSLSTLQPHGRELAIKEGLNTFSQLSKANIFLRRGGASGKEPTYQCRRSVPSLCWDDFPGEGNRNPLWYSCLENPMDREAWQSAVHGSQRVGHKWATNTSTFRRTMPP